MIQLRQMTKLMQDHIFRQGFHEKKQRGIQRHYAISCASSPGSFLNPRPQFRQTGKIVIFRNIFRMGKQFLFCIADQPLPQRIGTLPVRFNLPANDQRSAIQTDTGPAGIFRLIDNRKLLPGKCEEQFLRNDFRFRRMLL